MNTTTINEIEHIKEMLPHLSETALHEVENFTEYILEKERKHKEFVERILKIEKESDTVSFDSVNDAMKAIREWEE